MRIRRGRASASFILPRARRAHSSNVGTQAKLLKRSGIEPARAAHAVILLKMAHRILRRSIPLFRRIAVIVAFARERRLNFFDTVRRRSFLNRLPVLVATFLALLRRTRTLRRRSSLFRRRLTRRLRQTRACKRRCGETNARQQERHRERNTDHQTQESISATRWSFASKRTVRNHSLGTAPARNTV